MKILILFVIMAVALDQGNQKSIQGIEWSLIRYSDFGSTSVIEVSQSDCGSKFTIKFEAKKKFVATYNAKWICLGKYKERGNGSVKILAKINDKIHLTDEKCSFENPSIFDIKVMLANVFKYETGGDTLTLRFFKTNNREGIMDFVKKK